MAAAPTNVFGIAGSTPVYSHVPGEVVRLPVRLPASVSYAAGTVLGELTADPGRFAAYRAANSDGTQTARAVLEFAATTTADGLVANEFGSGHPTAPAVVAGTVRTELLVGLDEAAVPHLGRLTQGTVTYGLLRLEGPVTVPASPPPPPPPPLGYSPSLDYSDARNSQYAPLLFLW